MLYVLSSILFFLLAISFSQFPYFRNLRTMATKTIKDFGYSFNSAGQLRKIDPSTGLPGDVGFEFNISTDHSINQKNYEALGESITEYVYDLLRNKAQLVQYPVPLDGNVNLKSFIFGTNDIHTNADKLMVLIHGSGVVRAGQWARSLIINDSLNSGTQLPYIEKAKNLGYAVLITNTNDNFRLINNVETPISNSSTPEEHSSYVWKHYVQKSSAKFIAIVAHSYGGIVVTHLVQKYLSDFRQRVGAIALTDSVHGFKGYGSIPAEGRDYLSKVSINWVSSSDPLDTKQDSRSEDIPRLSAGTTKHEMTSYSCMESVFDFIESKFKSKQGSSITLHNM